MWYSPNVANVEWHTASGGRELQEGFKSTALVQPGGLHVVEDHLTVQSESPVKGS